MAVRELSKLDTRVRFPSPAPVILRGVLMSMKKANGANEGKKAYSEFKDECLRQIGRLGLKEWDIEIVHGLLDGEFTNSAAVSEIEEEGKLVRITLNKRFVPRDPKRVAKHEIGHVLLGKVQAIAGHRWANEAELDSEVEALCTRLEKVL